MCPENATNLEDGSDACPVAVQPGTNLTTRYAVIVSFGVFLNGTSLDDIAPKVRCSTALLGRFAKAWQVLTYIQGPVVCGKRSEKLRHWQSGLPVLGLAPVLGRAYAPLHDSMAVTDWKPCEHPALPSHLARLSMVMGWHARGRSA